MTRGIEVLKECELLKSLDIIRKEEIMMSLKELMINSTNNHDHNTLLKTIDIINKMQGSYTTIIDANINGNISLIIPGLEPEPEEPEEE